MKLVVIGAGGRTGRLVIERAVADGHRVTGVARRPASVGLTDPELNIVRGDVLEPDSLVDPLAAADAVCYLVGVPGRSTSVTRSVGMANLTGAMVASGVRRVFAVSPTAIDVSREAPLLRRATVKFLIDKRNRNPFLEYERVEDEMRHGGVEWTAIRVARLTDAPATFRYRARLGNHIRDERPLSRADLADYLLTHLGDESIRNAVVTVSGP
ncbi:NAD(P)-dependent oxidoreductase [Plantactinospora sp. KBS50]|uniref:NAD(P)-dependent oxidoreductase n=1 Tax=Plantactinospora sp. KBS50 TaxID=2024580 RepID=UPI000BAAC3B4|nr:NAD(P)H-binding protein [Plantactinospora sp. KBS50]ASW56779.1 hypothetical protein CIK06_25420 [Plantactinospora sp. KBS50]